MITSEKIAEFVEMCTRNNNIRCEKPVGEDLVFVFDIDDCLYQNSEISKHEANHVKNGFLNLSNLTEDDWQMHCSTFNLYREVFFSLFNIHPSDFCKVFDMPELHKFVTPDFELRELLQQISIRKFCFTNGSKERANMVLSYLQLESIFEAVVCADTIETEFICKPMSEAFEFFERYVGITTPKNIYFFDDSERNIQAAKRNGWNAMHVTVDIKECIKEVLSKINIS